MDDLKDEAEDAANVVPCSYPKCKATFANDLEMKRHKQADSDHEYCLKCNLDFADWLDHVMHRVESKYHITCIMCGMDFGSMSGLNRHQAQLHPINQDLECPYCQEHFKRAGPYVKHLEEGLCPKNQNSHFQMEANKQHKYIVKKILADPQDFNFNIESSLGAVAYDSDDEEDVKTDGGVILSTAFDENDEQRCLTHKVLQPEAEDLIDLKGGNTLAKPNLLPAKVILQGHHLAGADKGQYHSKEQIQTSFATHATAAAQEQCPSNIGEVQDGDCNEEIQRTLENITSWEYALARRDEGYEEKNSGNLMHSQNVHIYNPQSLSYDPSRFWNSELEAFRCPYAQCDAERNENFDSADEIKEHMVKDHTVTRICCPVCLKLFKTSWTLVAHAEMPISKCKLNQTRHFGQLIDELTGGFLNLKPETGKYNTPLFKAAVPPDNYAGRIDCGNVNDGVSDAEEDYESTSESEGF